MQDAFVYSHILEIPSIHLPVMEDVCHWGSSLHSLSHRMYYMWLGSAGLVLVPARSSTQMEPWAPAAGLSQAPSGLGLLY